MYIPDRVIARKLREYDPYLYLTWNEQKEYFELWREMPHGRRLITPVTQSIYEPHAPIKFVQLDERLVWWVQEADSWRNGGSKKHSMMWDSRWREWEKTSWSKKKSMFRDMAKDMWNDANAFYSTKHASKNRGIPNLNKPRHEVSTRWVRPDLQGRSRSRVWSRSRANALSYGFKK